MRQSISTHTHTHTQFSERLFCSFPYFITRLISFFSSLLPDFAKTSVSENKQSSKVCVMRRMCVAKAFRIAALVAVCHGFLPCLCPTRCVCRADWHVHVTGTKFDEKPLHGVMLLHFLLLRAAVNPAFLFSDQEIYSSLGLSMLAVPFACLPVS